MSAKRIDKVNISGVLMQATMDELLHVKFEGVVAYYLTKIDRNL